MMMMMLFVHILVVNVIIIVMTLSNITQACATVLICLGPRFPKTPKPFIEEHALNHKIDLPIVSETFPTFRGYGVVLDCQEPRPRRAGRIIKSRCPNFGPYTTKGYFVGTPLRALLAGSSQLASKVGSAHLPLQTLWGFS